MNISASVKALCEIKDITPELAKQIRHIWRTAMRPEIVAACKAHGIETAYPTASRSTREMRRDLISAIVGGFHGVEYLGQNRKSGESVYYCNAGDTYASTIIFHGRVLRVACWGDLVENGSIKERD